MVAACMTIHRVQGIGFDRLTVCIPLRGFFAQGQGYTAVSRGKRLDSLFLVVPDDLLEDREETKQFLNDAFHPPMDAIQALSGMRARAPVIVTVSMGVRDVQHATLWDSRRTYARPINWVVGWPILS